MRSALLVLFALATAGLAFPGTAQPSLVAVTLEIGKVPTVAPLQGIVEANWTVSASCIQNASTQPTTSGRVVVASQPAWATIVVSPASFVVDPTSCDASGYTRVTGTLHATATQDAPAFTPSDIVLVATLDGVKNASASARAPIEASYFSILDVQASEATALVAPGEKHGFALKISNFGNDDTRASFELVNASDDAFRVELPPPATLGSKQKGASVIELDTSVKVTAPEGNFLTNRVGTVTVRVVSADAAKPELRGDSATVSFVLTAHATPPGAARKLSPGPPLTGWLAAAGALALASPRRPRSLQR